MWSDELGYILPDVTWDKGERHMFECYRRTDTQKKGSL